VLAEFSLPDAPVVFSVKDGERVVPFHELLPLVFEMKAK
jgi:cytidine deaminase